MEISESQVGGVPALSSGSGVSKDYTGLHLPISLLMVFFPRLRRKWTVIEDMTKQPRVYFGILLQKAQLMIVRTLSWQGGCTRRASSLRDGEDIE